MCLLAQVLEGMETVTKIGQVCMLVCMLVCVLLCADACLSLCPLALHLDGLLMRASAFSCARVHLDSARVHLDSLITTQSNFFLCSSNETFFGVLLMRAQGKPNVPCATLRAGADDCA